LSKLAAAAFVHLCASDDNQQNGPDDSYGAGGQYIPLQKQKCQTYQNYTSWHNFMVRACTHFTIFHILYNFF
jgi:hypothetical protein